MLMLKRARVRVGSDPFEILHTPRVMCDTNSSGYAPVVVILCISMMRVVRLMACDACSRTDVSELYDYLLCLAHFQPYARGAESSRYSRSIVALNTITLQFHTHKQQQETPARW